MSNASRRVTNLSKTFITEQRIGRTYYTELSSGWVLFRWRLVEAQPTGKLCDPRVGKDSLVADRVLPPQLVASNDGRIVWPT